MPENVLLTLSRLNDEKDIVLREYEKLSLSDEKLEAVDVFLIPITRPGRLGYFGPDGAIYMPMISIDRLQDLFGGSSVSFRDVLRHEYAHALADTHRGLIRSKKFREVFGQAYLNTTTSQVYDPEIHVSEYASSMSCEDFAETVMYYVKHKGVIPKRWSGRLIHSKWLFIEELAVAIGNGQGRWG